MIVVDCDPLEVPDTELDEEGWLEIPETELLDGTE